MIKCCQNCHFFRKSSSIFEASGTCESGELKVIGGVADQILYLLEDGAIHALCEDLGLSDDDSETGDQIAEFFRKHLTDDAAVHVKDAQNFCCNAWR